MRACSWLLLCVGCAGPPTDPPSLDLPVHAVRQVGDIQVHVLRTGWVRVKQPHRELTGLESLAFPRILSSRRWAEWMPILTYVVVHPDKTVLVDTGPELGITDEGYYGCDEYSAFFYPRNLVFHVDTSEVLTERLRLAGLDASGISDVLITHWHADHIGGIRSVPRATVWTGQGNWPAHVGSFTCRLPTGFEPRITPLDDGPVGLFQQSTALTSDGRVRIVPLPGHTPGHAGLRVEGAGETWLIVGDATFDLDQTERTAIAGVSEDPQAARQTQEHLWRAASAGVQLLPAHDPAVFERLEGRPSGQP